MHSSAQIDWLAMHKTHEPHSVYLKLNSGMNRSVCAQRLPRCALRLSALLGRRDRADDALLGR